jgi:hypothetical protein
MKIEIIRTAVTLEKYDVGSYSPCCDDWREEFGDQVRILPDGSGIVPDGIFRQVIRRNKVVYVPLQKYFRRCPFCENSFEIKLTESVPVIQPVPIREVIDG